ncbi:hypothetical protein KGF54_004962 [Candida jiufengensis]|uniref:uncharacterized protein n=1 Tax=Candida jiufengensis TaxID=497108 RepID=UPI00222480E6|nr:uncharacterized protein KGF54_004962 [Candida jiufengensis]KAI5951887.1 hypothetical protein KGF54_004962 [Candida jiufengensis]
MLKEFNSQIIPYNKQFKLPPKPVTKYPRSYITIYGLSSLIPKHVLIEIFGKLSHLISYDFAPIGINTKYHVIKLQYSRFIMDEPSLINVIYIIFKKWKIKIKVTIPLSNNQSRSETDKSIKQKHDKKFNKKKKS